MKTELLMTSKFFHRSLLAMEKVTVVLVVLEMIIFFADKGSKG